MWNDLTMSERASVIKMAVKAGLRDMKSIRDFYDNSLKYANGGPKTNNREQDKPQISWMKNWLSSRKDILRKNAEATTWGYTKYSPKRNEGDVRESGWHGVSYENPWNPTTYLKGYTPTENRVNKIIYSQIENADDTPKQEVGYGSSNSYNMRGIYVEPNYWNNTGNYIAFAGQNVNPETKVHEFTHASHPEQQEQYIDKIIFKERTPNVVPGKKQSSRDNAKELYGALQEFRYKNNLKPEQIIDQKYIDSHRELFKDNYLENIPDEYKIKLFNDVAQNNSLTQPIEIDSIQPLLLKNGGSIHISPSKRGTFTAAAAKHSMGVQEFASKVLANKDSYSPAMVKKANFAKNASKWKHSLGGYLFEEGGPKATLVDSDKVRMNDSGVFSDDNGNIIGDSVVLPEVTIKPTTPQTNSSSYYQQWLMRQADRGGKNMSPNDREAYDRLMNRVANQNEVKNFTGFDGTIYNHGSGALKQVSPEFDVLTLGRQFYTDGLFDIIGNAGKNALKKAHIGNYYIKPQYNDYSYIRQVGDDAVEDMLRTNQMRSSVAIEREQRAWDELGALLGHESKEVSKPRLTLHKTFSDQMYYTGRPFYGDVRTNYLVTKPYTLTKSGNLTNRGLEWIESYHKNHTGVAKKLAEAKGIDPNTAPGRIVVPLWNGEKNVIPVDALGEFDLYRPVKLGNINMPFYKRYSYKR